MLNIIKKLLAGALLGVLVGCAAPKEVETVLEKAAKEVSKPAVVEEGYKVQFNNRGFVITHSSGFPKLTYTKFSAGSEPDCVLKLINGSVTDIGCEVKKIERMEVNGHLYLSPEGEDHERGLNLMKSCMEEMGYQDALKQFEERVSTENLEKNL